MERHDKIEQRSQAHVEIHNKIEQLPLRRSEKEREGRKNTVCTGERRITQQG
jgi:hypothetical protein